MAGSAADQQFIRYPIQLPVVYQGTNGTNHGTQIGWTRNLSEGGACLQLPERLQPRTSLWLYLKTDGESISAMARVVWSENGAVGPILHGVVFTRLAPLARQTLRDLIYLNGQVRPAGVRLPMDLAVTCRCKGQARSPVLGRTEDLSRGGLLLRLPQPMPLGTELVVTLHTPNEPLTLEGTIVWVEPRRGRPQDEMIRHGFQLTAVSFALSLTLARFMTMLPKEPEFTLCPQGAPNHH